MRQKKKKTNRVLISFAATVITLSVFVFVALSFQGAVPTYHLPEKLPVYGGVLGVFAPFDALQISLDNLSAIRSLNKTAIPDSKILQLATPPVSLNSSDMKMRITIALTRPNATVNVAILDDHGYVSLSSALNASPLPRTPIGDLSAFSVADTASGKPLAYWMALVPAKRALLFSAGALDALDGMKHVVGVMSGAVSSILTREDVNRMLYVGRGTDHLALGIQNFPGVVRTGLATLISVDHVGGVVGIRYVIRFDGTDTATSQVGTVKADYLAAHQFAIYDEMVEAVEEQPFSSLRSAVALVG